MKRLLRINVKELKATYEKISSQHRTLGGRGLTSSIVFDEVPPNCHPLRSKNKLVLAPGIVTGTSAPSSGRLSVGGKSPLTGGIKESNAGTSFAQKVSKLGIKAIIIEGQSKADGYYLLKISKDGAVFMPADRWFGMGLYEAFSQLRSEFGEDVGICGVGKAAEMRGSKLRDML